MWFGVSERSLIASKGGSPVYSSSLVAHIFLTTLAFGFAIALDFAAFVANAAVVEWVFSWPGIGRAGVEAALAGDVPLLLGFVLGPLMEENLRRAMLIARGDVTVFITRPISGVLIGTAVFLLVIAALPTLRKRRDEVFVE